MIRGGAFIGQSDAAGEWGALAIDPLLPTRGPTKADLNRDLMPGTRYGTMGPGQRLRYLWWLAGGETDQGIPGYVVTYLETLAQRVVFELRHDPTLRIDTTRAEGRTPAEDPQPEPPGLQDHARHLFTLATARDHAGRPDDPGEPVEPWDSEPYQAIRTGRTLDLGQWLGEAVDPRPGGQWLAANGLRIWNESCRLLEPLAERVAQGASSDDSRGRQLWRQARPPRRRTTRWPSAARTP